MGEAAAALVQRLVPRSIATTSDSCPSAAPSKARRCSARHTRPRRSRPAPDPGAGPLGVCVLRPRTASAPSRPPGPVRFLTTDGFRTHPAPWDRVLSDHGRLPGQFRPVGRTFSDHGRLPPPSRPRGPYVPDPGRLRLPSRQLGTFSEPRSASAVSRPLGHAVSDHGRLPHPTRPWGHAVSDHGRLPGLSGRAGAAPTRAAAPTRGAQITDAADDVRPGAPPERTRGSDANRLQTDRPDNERPTRPLSGFGWASAVRCRYAEQLLSAGPG